MVLNRHPYIEQHIRYGDVKWGIQRGKCSYLENTA